MMKIDDPQGFHCLFELELEPGDLVQFESHETSMHNAGIILGERAMFLGFIEDINIEKHWTPTSLFMLTDGSFKRCDLNDRLLIIQRFEECEE